MEADPTVRSPRLWSPFEGLVTPDLSPVSVKTTIQRGRRDSSVRVSLVGLVGVSLFDSVKTRPGREEWEIER